LPVVRTAHHVLSHRVGLLVALRLRYTLGELADHRHVAAGRIVAGAQIAFDFGCGHRRGRLHDATLLESHLARRLVLCHRLDYVFLQLLILFFEVGNLLHSDIPFLFKGFH